MVRPEKEQKVLEIKDKVEKSSVVVLTDYRGLTVAQITDLRRKLRLVDGEYEVVKNTLTRRAVSEKNMAELKDLLLGPTAALFGFSDPVTPVKTLADFIKENERPEVKGGFLDSRFLTAAEVKTLAKLPSREVLLANVARGMQAPISGLANVLVGPLRALAYALEAVKKRKK